MTQGNDEQARDLGRQLASKLEEYILKLEPSEHPTSNGQPLDERQIILGAADYFAYLANRIRTMGSRDTRPGEPEDN